MMWIVDPMTTWSPGRLALLGTACLYVGVALLVANVLEKRLEFQTRPALLIALTMGISGWYQFERAEWARDAIVWGSAVLGIFIPLALTLHLIGELTRID